MRAAEYYAKHVLGTMSDGVAEVQNHFDPFPTVRKAIASLDTPNTTLHVCERNVVCPCEPKTPCLCDSDIYFTVSFVNTMYTSKHGVQLHFGFGAPTCLHPSKTWRFFTLDHDTDTEVPVMDIVRCGKRQTRIVFPTLLPSVRFRVEDNRVHMRRQSIDVTVDYMNWE